LIIFFYYIKLIKLFLINGNILKSYNQSFIKN